MKLWGKVDLTYIFVVSLSVLMGVISTLRVGWTEIFHDLSSFLAPVALSNEGLSGLYSSFFDIKPPALLMLLDAWVSAFGSDVYSMFALNTLLIAASHLLTFLVISKIVSDWRIQIWVVIVMWTFFSDTFGGMWVTSELVGNFWALLALYLLFGSTNHSRFYVFFAAGAAAGLATLSKEVYVFVALFALIFHFIRWRGSRSRKILAVVAGGATSILITSVWLAAQGEFDAYVEVMRLKSALFPAPSLSSLVTSPFAATAQASQVLGFGVSLVLAISAAAFARELFDKYSQARSTAIMGLAIMTLTFAALAWQAKPMYGHYIATLLPSLTVVMSSTISILMARAKKPISRPIQVTAATLILLAALPNPSTFSAPINASVHNSGLFFSGRYVSQVSAQAQKAEDLGDRLSEYPCAQVAYGWSPGTFYMGAKIPPCNRFFLVNIILQSEELLGGYQSDLLANPAPVVVYDPDGADLDVATFETVIYPWKLVLDNCYGELEEGLFVMKSSQAALRACVSRLVAVG